MVFNLSLSYAVLHVEIFYVIELVSILPFMFLGLGSYFKRSSPLQHCKNQQTRCMTPTAAHLQCCRNQQRMHALPETWRGKPNYCSSPALHLTAALNCQLQETEDGLEYGPLGVPEGILSG